MQKESAITLSFFCCHAYSFCVFVTKLIFVVLMLDWVEKKRVV